MRMDHHSRRSISYKPSNEKKDACNSSRSVNVTLFKSFFDPKVEISDSHSVIRARSKSTSDRKTISYATLQSLSRFRRSVSGKANKEMDDQENGSRLLPNSYPVETEYFLGNSQEKRRRFLSVCTPSERGCHDMWLEKRNDDSRGNDFNLLSQIDKNKNDRVSSSRSDSRISKVVSNSQGASQDKAVGNGMPSFNDKTENYSTGYNISTHGDKLSDLDNASKIDYDLDKKQQQNNSNASERIVIHDVDDEMVCDEFKLPKIEAQPTDLVTLLHKDLLIKRKINSKIHEIKQAALARTMIEDPVASFLKSQWQAVMLRRHKLRCAKDDIYPTYDLMKNSNHHSASSHRVKKF